MFSTVRFLCFSDTMLWYSLQCSLPCSGSVKAALEKTTCLSWLTSTLYAWQSRAVRDVSKDKSWASLSRGKRQLRLLYPWLYSSSRSLRHATRWRCSAQVCRKFSLRANRSKRTEFLSRKAWLIERASEMEGVPRSRSGSSITCCVARAEPAEQAWRYYVARVRCWWRTCKTSFKNKDVGICCGKVEPTEHINMRMHAT